MTASPRSMLALILLAVVINLPLAHSTWTQQQVAGSGTDVTAALVDDDVVAGEEYWLSFTFPVAIDPEQRTWRARVDEEAYDDAVASQEVPVRVIEDKPSAYRVEGAVDSRLPLVITLVADLLLLIGAALLFRYGGRLRLQQRAPLRAVALGDVERCPPGTRLERIGGEDYLVRGEVLELGDEQVLLDLGNRTVLVLLDGHRNPVGHQQPAQVRARLIG